MTSLPPQSSGGDCRQHNRLQGLSELDIDGAASIRQP
jgi:hypothetical protein